MAKATRMTTLPPPPPPSKTTIALTLTQEEADMIRMLVGSVGGNTPQRRITQAIYDALHPVTKFRREFWPKDDIYSFREEME